MINLLIVRYMVDKIKKTKINYNQIELILLVGHNDLDRIHVRSVITRTNVKLNSH